MPECAAFAAKEYRNMLYFSYGSNMSSRRLRQRVPSARFVTVATLHQHELRFHKMGTDGSGKCDAHQTDNGMHAVMGVVFDIDSAEKAALDKIEGVGCGYETKATKVIATSGAGIEAFTYYATAIDSELKPYAWYKQHVILGAQEHALPAGYIDECIAAIETVVDLQLERQMRELAIY